MRGLKAGFQNIFAKDTTLSNKATKGIMLMSVRQILLQSLLLVKILIVAKVLGPSIYGTFGILLIVVLFTDQFTQFGFELELIHKPESQYQYNTAWTLKILRGLLLFLIIQLFHTPILNLFGMEADYKMLTYISSILIIEGFVNIGTIEFSKELNYRLEFIFRGIPDILNILFTISFLYFMQNIWALIAGLLAERISRLFLSYFLHSYRPKFHLKKDIILELIDYGKWILLMGVLAYFRLHGPDIFIGAILGASFVAIYQISFKLVTTPATAMSELIGSVSIPTYAKLQGNEESSMKTFYITLLAQLLVFNMYFSIFWPLISTFVNELLGSNWNEMVKIMEILFFVGYLILFLVSIEPVFVANGIQKILVKWQILVLLIFLISVGPVTQRYELIGITFLNLLTTLVLVILYVYELQKVITIPFKEVFGDAVQILLNGIITIALIFWIKALINFNPLLLISICFIIGSLIYVIITMFSHKIRKLIIIHELKYLFKQLLSQEKIHN